MIWIETLARNHDVLARVRVDAASATIGRAYDNDVVLDDPYVAAHHLRVVRADDGSLYAEDIGSHNGLVDESGQRMAQLALDGDRIVRIGRTLLRVRDERYPVAPERHEAAVARGNGRRARTAAGIAVALVALTSIEAWLSETTEPRASRYVFVLVALVSVVLVWTTAWALLSRLFSGNARFATHLTIALAGMLAYDLYDTAAEVATYSLSMEFFARYRYVFGWIFIGVITFFHLRAIGTRRLRLKGGVVAALVAAAVGTQTLVAAESLRVAGQQPYMSRLLPPALRLRAPDSLPEFFARVDTLREGLDRARDEEPADDAMLPFWTDP